MTALKMWDPVTSSWVIVGGGAPYNIYTGSSGIDTTWPCTYTDFTNAAWTNCTLSNPVTRADFGNTTWDSASIECRVTACSFFGADFSNGTVDSACDLEYSNFTYSTIAGTLKQVTVRHSEIEGTWLPSGSTFENANIVNSTLRGCNFTGAVVTSVNIINSWLVTCTLLGGPISVSSYGLYLVHCDAENVAIQAVTTQGGGLWGDYGALFEHCKLTGSLMDSNTVLGGTYWFNADMGGADFSAGNFTGFQVWDCTLNGISFFNANMTGTRFYRVTGAVQINGQNAASFKSTEMINCTLTNVNVEKTVFGQGNILSGCNIQDSQLDQMTIDNSNGGTTWTGMEIRNSTLSFSNFVGVGSTPGKFNFFMHSCDARSVTFVGTRGSTTTGAAGNPAGTYFENCYMAGAFICPDSWNGGPGGVEFVHCNLWRTHMSNTTLFGQAASGTTDDTHFFNCDLSNAILIGADFRNSRFYNCKFVGDFTGANFNGATYINHQLTGTPGATYPGGGNWN